MIFWSCQQGKTQTAKQNFSIRPESPPQGEAEKMQFAEIQLSKPNLKEDLT